MDVLVSDIKYDGSLKELDDSVVSSIRDSIKQHGLLHAVTVIQDGDSYKLVAGKKRLRACKELGFESIPVVVVAEDAFISLHENLRRDNLPWYEIVVLEKKLHDLRMSTHEARGNKGRLMTKDSWSMHDTARELGVALGTLSEDIKLATLLKSNPHLKNVKDKTTAIKLVRQMAKREESETYALISDDFENSVLLGDSSVILRNFHDGQFNACITDPPWSEYKVEELRSDSSTLDVFREIYRVLAYDSILYAVVSSTDFFMYKEELPKFGFKVQSWPLIWVKTGNITHGRRGWEYARDLELILVAAKGNPLLTCSTELSSILTFKPIRSMDLKHPNEKPVELIKKLILDSTYDGHKILDPFGGSGVLGSACKDINRKYTIIERDKKYYDQIVRRLA